MPQINLLPWREESLELQNKAYLTKLSSLGLIAFLFAFVRLTLSSAQLKHQNAQTR